MKKFDTILPMALLPCLVDSAASLAADESGPLGESERV
jgi:hypothetical protein